MNEEVQYEELEEYMEEPTREEFPEEISITPGAALFKLLRDNPKTTSGGSFASKDSILNYMKRQLEEQAESSLCTIRNRKLPDPMALGTMALMLAGDPQVINGSDYDALTGLCRRANEKLRLLCEQPKSDTIAKLKLGVGRALYTDMKHIYIIGAGGVGSWLTPAICSALWSQERHRHRRRHP